MDQTRRDEEFRQYVLHRRAELLRTATLLAAGDRHLGEDLAYRNANSDWYPAEDLEHSGARRPRS